MAQKAQAQAAKVDGCVTDLDRVADALKAAFRTMRVEWFVEDATNDGPCDMTPWNLLASAAIKAMHESQAKATAA